MTIARVLCMSTDYCRSQSNVITFDVLEEALGRYQLHGIVAKGGMGTVYLGRLLGPGGFARTVAVKKLNPNFSEDHEFAEMLTEEARLVAKIRHPNVVPVLDVVVEERRPALIMEFVHGVSVSEICRAVAARDEQIPPRIAATIIAGVLHGLHAAHEMRGDNGEPLDLVHRDVTPHNIIVGADGVTRVLDFGIAKAAARAQNTRTGQLKGKLGYFAPEQLLARPIDRRVDIYAASIVFWEMLTGQRLYPTSNIGVLVDLVMNAPIELPSKLVPSVSPVLDSIVLTGLAREPDARFDTARDMALALEKQVGVATASEVSEFLLSIAGPALDAMSKRLSQIENQSVTKTAFAAPSSKTRRFMRPAVPESDATPAPEVATAPPVERTHFPFGLTLLLAAPFVALLALSFFSGNPSPLTTAPERKVQSEAEREATEKLPTSVSAPAAPPPTHSVAPEGTAAAVAPPSSAAEPNSARSAQKPRRTLVANPSATSEESSRPATTARVRRCNPPYIIDKRGIKRMKVECL